MTKTLLFIVGLMLLGGTIGRLLTIVTAFTIAHSITLSLAALGVVHIPPAPVEVLIAASIFAVAVELTRQEFESRPVYIKILDHICGLFRSQF